MRLASLLALALLAVPALASAASRHEPREGVPLPARAPRTAAAAGRTCHVGSFTGVMMPGSSVCVKVGGFLRAETGTSAGHN